MIIYDVQNVMGVDSLENSAPLSKEVTNPTYDAEFGAIAYRCEAQLVCSGKNCLNMLWPLGASYYVRIPESSCQSYEHSTIVNDDAMFILTGKSHVARLSGRNFKSSLKKIYL